MLGKTKSGKPGYRVIRSTVVLSQHSVAITDIMDNELSRTIANVESVNFDFAQLEDGDLEVLYAHFDDKFMDRVKSEFMFIPHRGAIRDNGASNAICNLCGKGDSKDTDDNEDHIRYEFLLTNVSGGKDVWCGSTCIINYGLKVKGAETSAEAKKLLEKSLREHKRQWEVEEWQSENGDHANIPNQYKEFRKVPYMMRLHGELFDNFGELQLAGFDMDNIRGGSEETWKAFRTASRFYQRSGFLTEKKMNAWESAKRILNQVSEMRVLISTNEGVVDVEQRFSHFVDIGKERKKNRNA